VERLLAEREACEACAVFATYDGKGVFQQRRATEVDEIIRRSQGGSILDESILLCLCHWCHRRKTDNPDLAECLGLHLPGWATGDMVEETAFIRASWVEGSPVVPSWLEENTEVA
jgi:hypothetical protein